MRVWVIISACFGYDHDGEDQVSSTHSDVFATKANALKFAWTDLELEEEQVEILGREGFVVMGSGDWVRLDSKEVG